MEVLARPRVLLVTLCVGYFLVLLDVTVVNVALPGIGASLRAGGAALAATVTGYSVPFAALLLAAGAAGDRLGHRRVVLAGLAVFGVASAGAALAPGIGVLVAARAVQGVGAALLLPGTLAVLARAYPDARARARAVARWVAVGGTALPAGPVVGGLLVRAAGWRAVFWLNVPVVAAALVAAAAVLPVEPGDPERRPDLAGAALGAAGLGALVFAAAQRQWVAAGVAAALLAAFAARERRAADPMLPLALFRRRAFTAANAAALVMNGTCQGMLFLVTLLLQDSRSLGPLAAGLAMLPVFVPLVVLPPLGNRLAARLGALPAAALGLAVTGAGLAGLGWLGPHPAYWPLAGAFAVWGCGLGLLTPAVVTAAVGALPAARAGLASAVNNTARQAGGSLGVAAGAAVAGPATAAGFVGGFRLAALLAAAACAVAAGAVLAIGARPGRGTLGSP